MRGLRLHVQAQREADGDAADAAAEEPPAKKARVANGVAEAGPGSAAADVGAVNGTSAAGEKRKKKKKKVAEGEAVDAAPAAAEVTAAAEPAVKKKNKVAEEANGIHAPDGEKVCPLSAPSLCMSMPFYKGI